MRNNKGLTILLLMVLIGVFSTSRLPGLPCNSYQVDSLVKAYDTTASSIDFVIIDSQEKPLSGVKVYICTENFQGRKSGKSLVLIQSDSLGNCHTPLFRVDKGPLFISFFIHSKEIYHFVFDRAFLGLGYSVRVKLCNKN